MRIKIKIRRNADGTIRQDNDPYDYADDSDLFIWREGNFRCDCNRSLFWLRIGGDPDDEEAPCGESAFSVRISSTDGRELYAEF